MFVNANARTKVTYSSLIYVFPKEEKNLKPRCCFIVTLSMNIFICEQEGLVGFEQVKFRLDKGKG